MKPIVSILTLAFLGVATTYAQPAPGPKQIELAIHPQAIVEPALANRFLPQLSEQTPGNAASLYFISFLVSDHIAPDPDMDAMLDATPAQLPVDKARRFVEQYRNAIDRLGIAGQRTYCDWEPAYRERGYEALLPYLNSARQMANVLAIDAKLAIRERRDDQAIHDLQIGFTLARNVNRDPVAVQSLVAAGIESTMLGIVDALVQDPGAPNLYWPLANLPSAGGQREQMMQLEHAMLFYTYPGLKHPRRMTAEESRRVVQTLGRWSGKGKVDDLGFATLMMIRRYPEAKKFLIARGMDPHEMELLPADSVVLAYDLDEFLRREDAMEKWMGLPLGQAYSGISAEFRGPPVSKGLNPFMFVMFGYNRVLLQFIRADRKRDLLQIVEAIRAYAATHAGALPRTLDDLSPQTPAPPDPLTGRPFEYSVTDGTATLRGAPMREPASDEVYQIRLSR